MKIINIIYKLFGFGVFLAVLIFMGTCAWQNCRADTGPVSPSEAQYKLIIKNTGGTYLTKAKPSVVGKGDGEIYTLYGYWENTKGRYVYHDITLLLDESIFGEIEVSFIGGNK